MGAENQDFFLRPAGSHRRVLSGYNKVCAVEDGAFLPYGCCDQSSMVRSFRATEISSLTVEEAGSPKPESQQDCFSAFLPASASSGSIPPPCSLSPHAPWPRCLLSCPEGFLLTASSSFHKDSGPALIHRTSLIVSAKTQCPDKVPLMVNLHCQPGQA